MLHLAPGEGAAVACPAISADWKTLGANWLWGVDNTPSTGNITNTTQQAGVIFCNGPYAIGDSNLNGIGVRIYGTLSAHTYAGTSPPTDTAYYTAASHLITVHAGVPTLRDAEGSAYVARLDSSWKAPIWNGFALRRRPSGAANTVDCSLFRLWNIDLELPIKNGARWMFSDQDRLYSTRDQMNQWAGINGKGSRASNPNFTDTLSLAGLDDIIDACTHLLFWNGLSSGVDLEVYAPSLDRVNAE